MIAAYLHPRAANTVPHPPDCGLGSITSSPTQRLAPRRRPHEDLGAGPGPTATRYDPDEPMTGRQRGDPCGAGTGRTEVPL